MANEFADLKRPEAGEEDEEELLRQQEEFLKLKQKPSAKIYPRDSANVQRKAPTLDKPRSQFSMTRTKRDKTGIVASQSSGQVINPIVKERIEETSRKKVVDYTKLSNLPEAIPKAVLGDIVEKKYSVEEMKNWNSNVRYYETGFPPIISIDDEAILTQKRSNDMPSIQYEHMLRLQSSKNSPMEIQGNSSSSCTREEEANVIENQMATDIHKENLEKLAKMSEREILEEKRILEETLDPKLIEFLKNKKKKLRKRSAERSNDVSIVSEVTMDAEVSDNKEINLETDAASILTAEEATADMHVSSNKKIKLSLNDHDDTSIDSRNDQLNIPNSPKKILDESKQKGWLHMDAPEPEKLKWMEDLPEEKRNEPTPNADYNARFDFNGLLLPYKDESLIDRGLHHHGEEPERPGYSLQELLHLSRSATQQQRCTALITMANIMEKTRKGWYDEALNPSPLIALGQINILLLLRFSLDDSSVAVVTSALQALRAFLVSEVDEVCLDRLHEFEGYAQPTLMPQLEEKDTSDLKDHQLAQLDAVATLLRSDVLLRIRYILSEMHPPPIGVTCALEILIRLARHSHTTSLNISCTPLLLDTIVHNFMPLSIDQLAMKDAINNVYGIPVITAVRLCRVLVMYGKEPVAEKLNNFKVIHAILTYISSDTSRKDSISLSIESLRLWQSLLYYDVGLDSIAGARLTLISQLQLLLSNHDIENASELECEYATTLIVVASRENTLRSNISTLLAKWSTQLSSLSNIKWGVMKLIATTLSVVDEISAFKTTWLSNQLIFSTLRSTSNLLSDSNLATKREPSCLPNLAALMENEELQPILSVNSCTPFLATVMEMFCKHSRTAEIRSILEHSSFHKYIQNLEAADWSLERSWYSRMELRLLTVLVKAASVLGNRINNQTAHIIWKITIKLISALPADSTDHVRELFQIALSKEKISLEIITSDLAELDLASAVDQVKTGLSANVASLYAKYIVRNGDWSQAAMPRDWLFLPLVKAYEINMQKMDNRVHEVQNTKCERSIKLREDKDSILAVLSLALILPELMERLPPSLRFSRLILVYLCDAVYLDEDVSALLPKVISNLLRRHHAELNFSAEVPGLSSFTDLFTALCEEFCASSYGNDHFAMTLLVFLAQRHDVHYRRLLWSEHAGALRYLRLPRGKLVLPLREYLYPEEENTSLIESYITALVRGTVKETWCSIPYLIALHHSAMFLRRSNKVAAKMRAQVEKLRDKDLANRLLHYEPPQL
ncbi:RNA polymerase II-associated protein [Ooceraea biroi]|uniref:RNA polymerase II-associated protein n=1 Tax=Ooceraea biroi TaxID=2015173 RepID=A0A026WVF4_OOCBI|nr:RNA polymerase II-associated protein [Ooceraea biroi]